MAGRYSVDRAFLRPDPTPADHFATFDDPGNPEERQALIRETFDRWRNEGVKQGRVTITGPGIEGDTTGYPAGLWLEGWKDEKAQMLPFGAGYPDENGPCYPPLQAVESKA